MKKPRSGKEANEMEHVDKIIEETNEILDELLEETQTVTEENKNEFLEIMKRTQELMKEQGIN